MVLTGTSASGASVNLTTETLSDGTYQFINVNPGTYTVRTASSGAPPDFIFLGANPGSTGGTAGNNAINGSNVVGVPSQNNDLRYTQVFSKRLFLSN